MVNLALAWAEAYAAQHPDVQLSVTGGGSGTGIAALINGTVDVANASRSIKAEEVSAAEANGVTPVEHVVARDAIAIVVKLNRTITLIIHIVLDIVINLDIVALSNIAIIIVCLITAIAALETQEI